MPHLVEMHKKYKDQGLVVVTVALDDAGDAGAKEDVQKFLKKTEASFINLHLDEPADFVQDKLRVVAPPVYYVFNRQGKWTLFTAEGDKPVNYQAMDKLVIDLLREK